MLLDLRKIIDQPGSSLPFDENIDKTREVVRLINKLGIDIKKVHLSFFR